VTAIDKESPLIRRPRRGLDSLRIDGSGRAPVVLGQQLLEDLAPVLGEPTERRAHARAARPRMCIASFTGIGFVSANSSRTSGESSWWSARARS